MDSIWLDGVTLFRRTQEEYSYDLKRTIFSYFKGERRSPSILRVLHDVRLVVREGEKLAIIGPNGSGKSTLLKVIAGILRPSSGLVQVRGDVAALIELGAGFDGEMSAWDNIITYGIMLGFSKAAMAERADAILDWAELREYRNVPIKNFSTGMGARLGFAIATDVRPDILIVDETLSVGDEHFRHKCEERMERLWAQHTTVLLVSHDLGYIAKTCPRAIWLDRGEIRSSGETDGVINAYLEDVRRMEAVLAEQPVPAALSA